MLKKTCFLVEFVFHNNQPASVRHHLASLRLLQLEKGQRIAANTFNILVFQPIFIAIPYVIISLRLSLLYAYKPLLMFVTH